MVTRTLQRSKLWEVQTPQCIRPDLLRQGFALVAEKGLEVRMHGLRVPVAPTDARALTRCACGV